MLSHVLTSLPCNELICSRRTQACVLEAEADPGLEPAFCWQRDGLKHQQQHVWTK